MTIGPGVPGTYFRISPVINPGGSSRFRRCPNGPVGKDADCNAAATAFRVLVSLLVFTNPDRVRRMGASATVAAVTLWIGVQVPESGS